MEQQRICRFAIILAVPMLLVAGCSREMPTSSTGLVTRALQPADPAGAVTFVVPEVSGTVRNLPELGVLDIAPVSFDMQSSYFRTTDANREFRRGFAEFAIPNFKDVFSARIVLREARATTEFPLPPDRQELSMYTDVDLAVNTSDFDRPTSPLGTFETDSNLPTQTFAFDASRLVAHSRGARLGFRVRLEADPAHTATGFLGTTFARYSTPAGLRIEVTTTRAEANDRLQEMIRGMGLGPRVETDLLVPLQRVGVLLGDSNPNNDGSACGELGVFIREVERLDRNLQLSSVQAFDLDELAVNIMTSLGCPDRSTAPGRLTGPAEVAAR